MSLSYCTCTTDTQGRELAEHGSALFPIACYEENIPENAVPFEAVPWHWHEEWEAILVKKGTAPALSRRESRRRLRLCMNISSGNVKSLYRRYRLEGSERKWKCRSSMTDRSPFCSILKNCKKKEAV